MIQFSRKTQETDVVSSVRKHVVSDHCDATDYNGKSHATLVIIYIPNVI